MSTYSSLDSVHVICGCLLWMLQWMSCLHHQSDCHSVRVSVHRIRYFGKSNRGARRCKIQSKQSSGYHIIRRIFWTENLRMPSIGGVWTSGGGSKTSARILRRLAQHAHLHITPWYLAWHMSCSPGSWPSRTLSWSPRRWINLGDPLHRRAAARLWY